jgi:hypothetical protein
VKLVDAQGPMMVMCSLAGEDRAVSLRVGPDGVALLCNSKELFLTFEQWRSIIESEGISFPSPSEKKVS